MCDNLKETKSDSIKVMNYAQAQPVRNKESHMIYELKQQREWHIQELVKIQKAIDAVSIINSL